MEGEAVQDSVGGGGSRGRVVKVRLRMRSCISWKRMAGIASVGKVHLLYICTINVRRNPLFCQYKDELSPASHGTAHLSRVPSHVLSEEKKPPSTLARSLVPTNRTVRTARIGI